MIKDVDRLNPDDVLVIDITAKEALMITALPIVLGHLAHPEDTKRVVMSGDVELLAHLDHAFRLVNQCIEDGTLDATMGKISKAMEVAVYLRKQK